TERYGLEKIKTVGDAYMVAAGLPDPRPDHAEATADLALDMQAETARISEEFGVPLGLRIGINTGPVVAGVIGERKFAYDLWGDSVNTASRMESQGVENCIQLTESTYERLKSTFLCDERGTIPIKGKAEMQTYFLVRRQTGDR
ncbi:MAG: adenylate/guanylate cyclase domain-containing protein, partial [Rhodospirillales bacterium]|nr:adenylate/guanylate cyclase domain-containing protein [Rhodospirillales bacterium]